MAIGQRLGRPWSDVDRLRQLEGLIIHVNRKRAPSTEGALINLV